ncbi:hypothetical protein F444_20197 [Phytophthora nicotianae P1976]|uniref:Uncharacterized protein n=1 Tax=Phytophthora nicotianae P1976 TaxID=1317066 RepID=A0A080Z5D3_PHYNI|nr:hypothetical protein F444_20197 [Phytophthora nicotianae P1976]
MEQTNAPQTFGEMLQFFAHQQERLQAAMNEQIAAQAARLEAIASRPPATRRAEPPKYTVFLGLSSSHGGEFTYVRYYGFLLFGTNADELVSTVCG